MKKIWIQNKYFHSFNHSYTVVLVVLTENDGSNFVFKDKQTGIVSFHILNDILQNHLT